MRNIIKWTLLLPVVLFFVLLALANRHIVTVRLDPLAGADSLLPTFDIPLFAVLFIGLLAGTIFGGVGTWVSQGKHRKSARQARASAKKWQGEAESLNRARQQQQQALGATVGSSKTSGANGTSEALSPPAKNDDMRSLN